MSNAVIYNATNDNRTYLEVLAEVPQGGYIWTGSFFFIKMGWRNAKQIDFRHADSNPHGAELVAYATEMNRAHALYRAAIVGLKSLIDAMPSPYAETMQENFRRQLREGIDYGDSYEGRELVDQEPTREGWD